MRKQGRFQGDPQLPWLGGEQFPLYLAPMARFTDIIYRELCKKQGADVLVTEFVLADAVVRGDPKVWEALEFTQQQRPIGLQIFGSDAAVMASAANILEQRYQPDFIDLNFGCPADRVVCRDAGSSLLRSPERLEVIVKAVVDAVTHTPVTAKIRIGWDADSIVAVDVAQRVARAGAKAITVHGRTKEQGYRGDADWDTIGSVAEAVDIAVIGNGSLQTAEDVARARERTAVAGVMIGRAALGYPWLFAEIKRTLSGQPVRPPSTQERWETILNYAELLLERPGRDRCAGRIHWMRPKLMALTKDLRGGRKLRGVLEKINTMDELRAMCADYSQL